MSKENFAECDLNLFLIKKGSDSVQVELALSQSASTDKTRKSSDRIFLAMTARSADEPLADYLGSGLLA